MPVFNYSISPGRPVRDLCKRAVIRRDSELMMRPGTKPQLAFFTTLFLMLAGALFGVYELKESLNRYRTEVKASNDHQIAFDEIMIDFKEQVQEWKDTLLLGKDPGDRERYWGAFLEREGEVDAHTRALIATLSPGNSRTLLEQIAREHEKLSASYRRGFDRLKASGFDPAAAPAPLVPATAHGDED